MQSANDESTLARFNRLIGVRPLYAATALLIIGVADMNASPVPPVTVTSLPSDGVLLLSSAQAGFQKAFRPGRVQGYDGLLPYTVVIQNNSGQEVIAYAVIWNCVGVDGMVRPQVRSVFNFAKLDPGANLVSGRAQPVAMMRELEAGGQIWDAKTEVYAKRLVESFASQAQINIALDAVLFADGTAVGPDRAHWVSKWKAWLDAEKEVFTNATRSSPEDVVNTLSQLAAPGAAIVRQKSPQTDMWSAAAYSVMADRAESYAESLALAKGYFALSILRELEENKLPTMENLRRIIQSKRYPDVHKKMQ